MINIAFENIQPSPAMPSGVKVSRLIPEKWSNSTGYIGKFKNGLKEQLRSIQKARCCFCRRRLATDDCNTQIEHFIEKARHPEYTYEILNLALCCGVCNSKKNGYDKSYVSRFKKRYGLTHMPRCASLAVNILTGDPLPVGSDMYRWVHPHFDKYSENIIIEKSWVFRGRTRKGIRTVKAMRLNELAAIEHRALHERIEDYAGEGRLLTAWLMTEETFHRQEELAQVLAAFIAKQRKKL